MMIDCALIVVPFFRQSALIQTALTTTALMYRLVFSSVFPLIKKFENFCYIFQVSALYRQEQEKCQTEMQVRPIRNMQVRPSKGVFMGKITNVSTGIDPARIQQNQPAFFVSWCEDGKRQYYFSAIRSEIERMKQRLLN